MLTILALAAIAIAYAAGRWIALDPGTEGANATDQWCTTAVEYVPTVLYPPILEDDGTYSAEFIKVYGISHHHGLAPRIHVGIGESFGIEITAAEARETAAALLKVANQMEVSR